MKLRVQQRQRITLDLGLVAPLLGADVTTVKSMKTGRMVSFIKVGRTAVAAFDVLHLTPAFERGAQRFSRLEDRVLRRYLAQKGSYSWHIFRFKRWMCPLLPCWLPAESISHDVQGPWCIHNGKIQPFQLFNPACLPFGQEWLGSKIHQRLMISMHGTYMTIQIWAKLHTTRKYR